MKSLGKAFIEYWSSTSTLTLVVTKNHLTRSYHMSNQTKQGQGQGQGRQDDFKKREGGQQMPGNQKPGQVGTDADRKKSGDFTGGQRR
jgi:hypothetical protein